MNRNRKPIRLTESQLHRVIRESVMRVISESDNEDRNVGDVIREMGSACDTIRDCVDILKMILWENGGSIQFDGEEITSDRIDGWNAVLEDINNMCYI